VQYYQLDQVGVELEGPFGTHHNDFDLLTMGLRLCNDLDAIVRTVRRSRMEARLTNPTPEEHGSIRTGAEETLGWERKRGARRRRRRRRRTAA